jgi:hypothetical protein
MRVAELPSSQIKRQEPLHRDLVSAVPLAKGKP